MKEKAHEDPNHHHRHLRRPRFLDVNDVIFTCVGIFNTVSTPNRRVAPHFGAVGPMRRPQRGRLQGPGRGQLAGAGVRLVPIWGGGRAKLTSEGPSGGIRAP
jgi:hypothetical protein